MNTIFAQYAAATARRTYIAAVPRDLQNAIACMLDHYTQADLIELCKTLHDFCEQHVMDYEVSPSFILALVNRPQLVKALITERVVFTQDLAQAECIVREYPETQQSKALYKSVRELIGTLYGDPTAWIVKMWA